MLTHARVCQLKIGTVLLCKKKYKKNCGTSFHYKSIAFNELNTQPTDSCPCKGTMVTWNYLFVSKRFFYSSPYLNNSILCDSNNFNDNLNYFRSLLYTYVSYLIFGHYYTHIIVYVFTYSYWYSLYYTERNSSHVQVLTFSIIKYVRYVI
jgi:hypothetical protein